jgi:hypothetical protein
LFQKVMARGNCDRTPRHRLAAAAALAVAAVGAIFFRPGANAFDRRPVQAADTPNPAAPMRGMVVSCPMNGRVWATDAMRSAVRELRRLGVRWVQIHPYAGIRRDGRVSWKPATPDGFVARGLKLVRREGMLAFSKPHLAYWGRFSWRGEIGFSTESEWRRFFEHYTAFIVDQARAAEATETPLFAVGTELKSTLHRERDWRRVIDAVRRVYSGRLTYAANWDAVEKVPFWDAVDLIGVQAYFPVRSDPSDGSIRAGVAKWMNKLEGFATRLERPVILTEVGYPRSTEAARTPWKPAVDDDPRAIALRRALTDAVLHEASRHPSIHGMFWWKWIPGWTPWDRDFSMKDPEMKAALQTHWASEKANEGDAP